MRGKISSLKNYKLAVIFIKLVKMLISEIIVIDDVITLFIKDNKWLRPQIPKFIGKHTIITDPKEEIYIRTIAR